MNWLPTLQSNLVVSFLILLSQRFEANAIFPLLFLFVIFQVFVFAYTFVVNDISDRDIDLSAGKIRPIQEYSKRKQTIIIVTLAAAALSIPLSLGDSIVKITSIITFLLLTFYSFKPLRFKERGIIGLIVAAGAQRSALFLVYGQLLLANASHVLFFMIWLFIIGFQDELGHQLTDMENDEKASVKTWVSQVGQKKGKRVSRIFLLLTFGFPFLSFLFFDVISALAVSVVLIIFRLAVIANLYSIGIFSNAKNSQEII
jgi:4-hydroxybenzoate polyprenyltransferase